MLRSVSGTSSGKEKAVVASLTCSPGGRCTNVNVNGLSLEYVSFYLLTTSLSFPSLSFSFLLFSFFLSIAIFGGIRPNSHLISPDPPLNTEHRLSHARTSIFRGAQRVCLELALRLDRDTKNWAIPLGFVEKIAYY